MKTKYIARLEGQIVGTRSSDRTYTHAIVIQGHGKGPHVRSWSSRPDLARGEQAKWTRYGYTATIVPAEMAPSKARKVEDASTADYLSYMWHHKY